MVAVMSDVFVNGRNPNAHMHRGKRAKQMGWTHLFTHQDTREMLFTAPLEQ